MKLLLSDARNEATLATSSGLPIRPKGGGGHLTRLKLFDLFLILHQSITDVCMPTWGVYRTRTEGIDADLAVFPDRLSKNERLIARPPWLRYIHLTLPSHWMQQSKHSKRLNRRPEVAEALFAQ